MEPVTSPAPAVPPAPSGDRGPHELPNAREPGGSAPPPDESEPHSVDAIQASDDPRTVLARRRGLPGPYITGGEDADPSASRREERRYGSLLLAMVVVIVLAGFLLGIIGVLLGAGAT